MICLDGAIRLAPKKLQFSGPLKTLLDALNAAQQPVESHLLTRVILELVNIVAPQFDD